MIESQLAGWLSSRKSNTQAFHTASLQAIKPAILNACHHASMIATRPDGNHAFPTSILQAVLLAIRPACHPAF
jgi:hypothetical protein